MALLDFLHEKTRTSDVTKQVRKQSQSEAVTRALREGYKANANAAVRLEDTIRELLDLKGAISQEVYHLNAPSPDHT
jgi:hypothetical protein